MITTMISMTKVIIEMMKAIDPMHKYCQFKILLYGFKLARLTSFQSKNSFELSTQKRG